MLINEDLFIEVDSCQRVEKGNLLSGNAYIQKRFDGYMVALLFSGHGGTCVERNISASMFASAAIKHFEKYSSFDKVVKSILGLVTISYQLNNDASTDFVFVRIDDNSNVDVVCYGIRKPIFMRGESVFEPECNIVNLDTNYGLSTSYIHYKFKAQVEDRLLYFNDIVVADKINNINKNSEKFWEDATNLVESIVKSDDTISATELSRKIIMETYNFDSITRVVGDQSCGVVYFRKPRRVLICSGPPYNQDRDKYLAESVRDYDGETIICGGTTAGIVSRELSRDISVLLGRDPSGLPNASTMEGVTMITEGVLTLGKVKGILENISEPIVKGRGIDIKFVKLLLNHDVVDMIVGTRINAMHQDPNIPVELELRRNVMKDIAWLLKTKFYKEVNIQYI